MPETPEVELLDGARSLPEVQAEWAGTVQPLSIVRRVPVGWYDADVDPNLGCFAMVASGGTYDGLVGDFVRVRTRTDTLWVYVVGGSSDLDTEFCLARRAYLELAHLDTGTFLAELAVKA